MSLTRRADHGSRFWWSHVRSRLVGKGELTITSPVVASNLGSQKYLLPHLQPPTTTSFQQTSAELASQFDEASKLLAELQSQTSDLQESVEKEREKVDAVVEEVGDAVAKVKEGEEKWREEMRELREEVQELRDLVPKVSRSRIDGVSH